MFNIFDPQFWILIGTIIGLVVLVVLAINFKEARYIFAGIICLVIIGSGVYSAHQLHGYYSASGGIYGKIFGAETTTVTVDEMEFNFENMELLETDSNTHEVKVETPEVFGLDVTQSYEIKINGEPCKLVAYGEEYAISEYQYNFYDSNLECVMSDKLTIRFSFFSNRTILVVSTNGGDDAIKYWNSYFNNNTFIVSVKPVENLYSQSSELELGTYEGDVNSFVKATFNIEGVEYLSKVALVDSTITLPQIDHDLYGYWSLDGETRITESVVTITEDTTFHAMYYTDEDFFLKAYNNMQNGVLDLSVYPMITIPCVSNIDRSKITSVNFSVTTTVVKAGAFEGSGLTSVTIPENILTIENLAFNNCTKLSSVTLAHGVQTLGACAFGYCTSLTYIELPNTITEVSVDVGNAWTFVNGEKVLYTFYGCTNLKIKAIWEEDEKTLIENWNSNGSTIIETSYYVEDSEDDVGVNPGIQNPGDEVSGEKP